MRFWKFLILFVLSCSVSAALSAGAEEKPFTQQQILDMVKAGLGNGAGAKLVTQRGIDFMPSQKFLKHLKSAGAKDSFLKALRSNKPLTKTQINEMVRAGVGDDSGAQMVTQRGLDFAPTEDYIQTLKPAWAKDVLVLAMRCETTQTGTVPPRNTTRHCDSIPTMTWRMPDLAWSWPPRAIWMEPLQKNVRRRV